MAKMTRGEYDKYLRDKGERGIEVVRKGDVAYINGAGEKVQVKDADVNENDTAEFDDNGVQTSGWTR